MSKLLALAFCLWSSLALAQGCGPTNPNCIVPTAPAGTRNNQAASTAFAQTAASSPIAPFAIIDAGPNFATLTTIYDTARITINGFSINNEFGAQTVGVAQAVVGGIEIPASSTGLLGAGVAGYARNSSLTMNAVGIYGQGTINASGAATWGGNVVATNCPLSNCTTNGGLNGNVYGFEMDVNIEATGGGGTPSGNARGIYVNGNINKAPASALNAIEIDHAGSVLWTVGLNLDAGCCTLGVNLNQLATGSGHGSQPIFFASTSAGAVVKQAAIQTDQDGSLLLTAGAGSGVVAASPLYLTGLNALGSPPTLTGTCAAGTQTGGNIAGTLTTTGACAGTTIILSFSTTAITGWACDMQDQTAAPATLPRQTASSLTSATMTVTTAGAEVMRFKCMAY